MGSCVMEKDMMAKDSMRDGKQTWALRGDGKEVRHDGKDSGKQTKQTHENSNYLFEIGILVAIVFFTLG